MNSPLPKGNNLGYGDTSTISGLAQLLFHPHHTIIQITAITLLYLNPNTPTALAGLLGSCAYKIRRTEINILLHFEFILIKFLTSVFFLPALRRWLHCNFTCSGHARVNRGFQTVPIRTSKGFDRIRPTI